MTPLGACAVTRRQSGVSIKTLEKKRLKRNSFKITGVFASFFVTVVNKPEAVCGRLLSSAEHGESIVLI